MASTSSPWSREASPSVVLPEPQLNRMSTPSPPHIEFEAAAPRPRLRWLWMALACVLVVGISAGVGSFVTYVALRDDRAEPSPSLPIPPTPQFSAAEITAAQKDLCHVFDVSVGHEGRGGFRVQGNLNVPVTLQALTSAVAVQNALVPATPSDLASATKRYISTTLDVATAAMGNTPTSEVNRLTDTSNEAINTLLDVCGLPR